MKKLNASSAIGMLLALLIISLLFIFMMPALKDIGSTGGVGTNSINKESVETRVNKQIEEIENMRRQTIDINRKINQEY